MAGADVLASNLSQGTWVYAGKRDAHVIHDIDDSENYPSRIVTGRDLHVMSRGTNGIGNRQVTKVCTEVIGSIFAGKRAQMM